MRASLLAGIFAITAACGAGAQGGGAGSTEPAPRTATAAAANRTFQVGAFDRILLAGPPNVMVAVGGPPSIRAEGDAELVERLEIEVVNGELRIGLRPGTTYRSHGNVVVHVTVPSLRAATISGPGDINIDRVEGQAFAAAVSGPGDLDVRQLRVGNASFTLTGPGGIRAVGGAQRVSAAVSGPGDLRLAAFEAVDATVSLNGPGDVALRATGTAAVQLSGSGDVTIAGGARCTVARAGPGDVDCGS